MKTCCMCKHDKQLTEFYKAKLNKDGLQTYCKLCNHFRRRTKTEEQRVRGNQWGVEYNKRVRLEALTYYCNGQIPKCSCCGEMQYEFLALDHINNDGAVQRKIVRGGNALVKWLRARNWPEGYQVLCHNCNMAKGFYGTCPHQKAKLMAVA